MWKSDPKAWVIQAIFQDWFFHHFITEVEKYCLEKNILFSILFPAQQCSRPPPFMGVFHPNIKIVHLPPNTLYAPMDHRVIVTFKKCHLHHTFCQAVKTNHKSGIITQQFSKDYNILKEISPEYSLEGLMLKLKLQYCRHLIQRADSLEKTLMLGKIEAGGEGNDRG